MVLDAPLGKINLHLRGGYIVPTMIPETTTTETAQNPVLLAVSLDESGRAKGHMYWDDGDDIGEKSLVQFLPFLDYLPLDPLM